MMLVIGLFLVYHVLVRSSHNNALEMRCRAIINVDFRLWVHVMCVWIDVVMRKYKI